MRFLSALFCIKNICGKKEKNYIIRFSVGEEIQWFGWFLGGYLGGSKSSDPAFGGSDNSDLSERVQECERPL